MTPEDLKPADHFLFWEALVKHWPVIADELHSGLTSVYGQRIKDAIDALHKIDVLDDMFEFDPRFKEVVKQVAAGRALHDFGEKDVWAVVDTFWDWRPAYGLA